MVDLCGGSDKDDDSVIDLTSEKDDGSARAPTPPPKQEHAVRVHFGMSGSLKVDSKTPGYGARALRCAFDGGRTLEVFNAGEYGGVHAARRGQGAREGLHAHELGRLFRSFRSGGGGGAARRVETTKTVAVAGDEPRCKPRHGQRRSRTRRSIEHASRRTERSVTFPTTR